MPSREKHCTHFLIAALMRRNIRCIYLWTYKVYNDQVMMYCVPPQLLFQYPVSHSQPAPFYVGGPMGGIDNMAGTEPSHQAPPPASMTPAPPPSTPSCSAGPSPSSQGSETSFDCTHCGKSLRSRKNYSKHMFIHSGKFYITQ